MEVKSEEQIIRGMEGIFEEDLQKRLKDFYKKRETYNGKQLDERQRMFKENNELCIKVYERVLSIAVIERARRSAGIYKTQEEIGKSIAREEESLVKNDNEIDR